MKNRLLDEMHYVELRVCAHCNELCDEQQPSGGGRVMHAACRADREKRIAGYAALIAKTERRKSQYVREAEIMAEFHSREESGNL